MGGMVTGNSALVAAKRLPRSERLSPRMKRMKKGKAEAGFVSAVDSSKHQASSVLFMGSPLHGDVMVAPHGVRSGETHLIINEQMRVRQLRQELRRAPADIQEACKVYIRRALTKSGASRAVFSPRLVCRRSSPPDSRPRSSPRT